MSHNHRGSNISLHRDRGGYVGHSVTFQHQNLVFLAPLRNKTRNNVRLVNFKCYFGPKKRGHKYYKLVNLWPGFLR